MTKWDAKLYEGSAAYYARGRLPYPPETAAVLRDVLSLDGTGRLIDVGCGPGSVALLLAPLLAEVVGVDPDPGMIAEAPRQASKQRVRKRTVGRAAGRRSSSGRSRFVSRCNLRPVLPLDGSPDGRFAEQARDVELVIWTK